MAKHLDNIACPECRKVGKDKRGDNLGIYDDGSAYCFSCGYFVRSGVQSTVVHPNQRKRLAVGRSKLYLPSGLLYPSSKALVWLKKYHIDSSLIKQHNIQWYDKEKALVFPIYEGKDLIFYQKRYFDPSITTKKWQSYGPKPLIFLGSSSTVVLVEDLISAIRVSEHATAVPLFGSTIEVTKLLQIKEKNYTNIKIWLDYDKATDKKTEVLKNSCKILFKETEQIVTEKDPKVYTSEEIRIKLNTF